MQWAAYDSHSRKACERLIDVWWQQDPLVRAQALEQISKVLTTKHLRQYKGRLGEAIAGGSMVKSTLTLNV